MAANPFAHYTQFGNIFGRPVTMTPDTGTPLTVGGLTAATQVQIDANGNVLAPVANALTAAGTTRADALQLAYGTNSITTAAASTGVNLPAAIVGAEVTVFNLGANAIKVYALASDTIDGTAGATGVTLTNAKRCVYTGTAAATWISNMGVASA